MKGQEYIICCIQQLDSLLQQHRLEESSGLNRHLWQLVRWQLDNLDAAMLTKILLTRSAVLINECDYNEALNTIKLFDKYLTGYCLPEDVIAKRAEHEFEVFFRTGNLSQALSVADHTLAHLESNLHRAQFYKYKGRVEKELNGTVYSLNSLVDALHEAEASGDEKTIASVYKDLFGMFHLRYPALALYFLRKAETCYQRINATYELSAIRQYIATGLWFLSNADTRNKDLLLKHSRQVLKSIDRKHIVSDADKAYYNRLHGIINNDEDAIEEAWTFYQSTGNIYEIARTAEMRFQIYLKNDSFDKALGFLPTFREALRKKHPEDELKQLSAIEPNLKNHIHVDYIVPFNFKPADEPDTLLDILDKVSYDEELWYHNESTFRCLFPSYIHEGMFTTLTMPDGQTKLVPNGLFANRYYRGENAYHPQCSPSLYRPGMTEAKQFAERLKYAELSLLMEHYPLTQIYRQGFYATDKAGQEHLIHFDVDHLALAQHYGIATELLDLTTDKFVAAFFACTNYDDKNYSPKKENGDNGCFYYYYHRPPFDYRHERLHAVGLQPFSRPGEQSGFVYKMLPEQNFNTLAQKHIFKHDAKVAEFIFNYTNRSNKLFPKSVLEDKAAVIKASKTFSRAAYEKVLKEFYPATSESLITSYLNSEGITLCESPITSFSDKEIKQFYHDWKNGGEKRFANKVMIQWVYNGPITINK